MFHLPEDLSQLTDKELTDNILGLQRHKETHGHGRSPDAAYVREFVREELKPLRKELRRRGLNVHHGDDWRFPGVTKPTGLEGAAATCEAELERYADEVLDFFGGDSEGETAESAAQEAVHRYP